MQLILVPTRTISLLLRQNKPLIYTTNTTYTKILFPSSSFKVGIENEVCPNEVRYPTQTRKVPLRTGEEDLLTFHVPSSVLCRVCRTF